MSYRKGTSILIVLALLAICGSARPAFAAAEGDDDSKKEKVTTVYSVEETSPETIVPVLGTIAPDATMTVDPKGQRLVVVASPADHLKSVASLKSFEKVVDVTEMAPAPGRLVPDDELQTIVYATGDMRAQNVAELMRGTAPGATFAIGEDNQTLIVIAKRADHEKVRNTLRSLATKPVDAAQIASTPEPLYSEDEVQTTVYAVGEMTALNVMRIMRDTAPEAIFSAGKDDKTLIVVAKRATHEKVRNTLKNLAKTPIDVTKMAFSRGPLAEDEPRIAVYAIGENSLLTLLPLLQTTAPKVQFSAGEGNKTLIVYGKQADHEKVCETLRSLGKKAFDPFEDRTIAIARPVLPGPRIQAATKSSPNSTRAHPPRSQGTTQPTVSWQPSPNSASRNVPWDSQTKTMTYSVFAPRPTGGQVSTARKQEPADPEMVKMEQMDANYGQIVAEIVEECKEAIGQEQQGNMRLELKRAVNEHFIVRQGRRELEVFRLEARLKKIRESIAQRKELQQEIVDRHILELLGETDGLEF